MDPNHPCHGCTAQPVDHAVVCPYLGVIASPRCKRLQRMPVDRMLQAMYFGSRNSRREIVPRSKFFENVFEMGWKATKALATASCRFRG